MKAVQILMMTKRSNGTSLISTEPPTGYQLLFTIPSFPSKSSAWKLIAHIRGRPSLGGLRPAPGHERLGTVGTSHAMYSSSGRSMGDTSPQTLENGMQSLSGVLILKWQNISSTLSDKPIKVCSSVAHPFTSFLVECNSFLSSRHVISWLIFC